MTGWKCFLVAVLPNAATTAERVSRRKPDVRAPSENILLPNGAFLWEVYIFGTTPNPHMQLLMHSHTYLDAHTYRIKRINREALVGTWSLMHVLSADHKPQHCLSEKKNCFWKAKKMKRWGSQILCRPDTRQRSYLMETDIGIHPAFAFRIKIKCHPDKNIYYMTGVPHYLVNADWLYWTCSCGKSQIANLTAKCSRWDSRRHHLTMHAAVPPEWFLLTGAVMCSCKMHLLTGFRQMSIVLALDLQETSLNRFSFQSSSACLVGKSAFPVCLNEPVSQ